MASATVAADDDWNDVWKEMLGRPLQHRGAASMLKRTHMEWLEKSPLRHKLGGASLAAASPGPTAAAKGHGGGDGSALSASGGEQSEPGRARGPAPPPAPAELRVFDERGEFDAEGEVEARRCESGHNLRLAAICGDVAALREALAQGADVDQGDELEGNTALFEAARKGHAHVVAELLGHGVTIEKRNQLGQTPMQEAVREGQRDVVRLLIAHRGEVQHPPHGVDAGADKPPHRPFLAAAAAAAAARALDGQAGGPSPLTCLCLQGGIGTRWSRPRVVATPRWWMRCVTSPRCGSTSPTASARRRCSRRCAQATRAWWRRLHRGRRTSTTARTTARPR
jgi:hypothetical protein